jgi:hypothetical protein
MDPIEEEVDVSGVNDAAGSLESMEYVAQVTVGPLLATGLTELTSASATGGIQPLSCVEEMRAAGSLLSENPNLTTRYPGINVSEFAFVTGCCCAHNCFPQLCRKDSTFCFLVPSTALTEEQHLRGRDAIQAYTQKAYELKMAQRQFTQTTATQGGRNVPPLAKSATTGRHQKKRFAKTTTTTPVVVVEEKACVDGGGGGKSVRRPLPRRRKGATTLLHERERRRLRRRRSAQQSATRQNTTISRRRSLSATSFSPRALRIFTGKVAAPHSSRTA